MHSNAYYPPSLPGSNRNTRRAARSLAVLGPDLAVDLVIRRLGRATTAKEVREAYAVGMLVLHPELAEGRAAA